MTAITRAAAIEALERALAEQSFADFLLHLKIRSDDPNAPGLTPLLPWGFQVERAEAWQSGAWEAILKERQMGFTYVLVATYLLWRAMYFGWRCAYTSVDQSAAREQVRRIRSLYDSLPRHLRVRGEFRADDVTFEGGGGIVAFASTDHAGISYTFQLWVQDEAGFHPYASDNFAAILPAVANGQVLVLSTANPALGPSGHFHDLYWASKRGDTRFTAVFEARRRPDRDAAWYARTRLAYAGKEDEFDAYYPETDAAAFVARSGLVYPMFSEERHVKPATFTLAAAVRVVAGVDFGGGDPTAVIILGIDGRQHVHQFAELYKRGPVGADEIAAFLADYRVDEIMCDPSQGATIATMRSVYRLPARPADNARKQGLSVVATLLATDRLTIEPSCRDSIAEFPGYRWSERSDPNDRTRFATSTPVDNHADGMDARRYAAMRILSPNDPARMVTMEVADPSRQAETPAARHLREVEERNERLKRDPMRDRGVVTQGPRRVR